MTLPIAEGILFKACSITGLYPSVLRTKTRKKEIARTRQAIMFVLNKRTDWSFGQIARFVGLKDHTTAIHGIRMAPEFSARYPDFKALVDELMDADSMFPFGVTEALQRLEAAATEAIRKEQLLAKPERLTKPVRQVNIEAMMEVRRPKKPVVREFLQYHGEKCVVVDEGGRDDNERVGEHNVIVGSAKLAKALHRALAARAAA